MEEMARLQNQVGDKESEAAALKKEVGKLKVGFMVYLLLLG